MGVVRTTYALAARFLVAPDRQRLFRHLSRYLSDNNITRINDSVFHHLQNLNELNLGNNNISIISSHAFIGLSKLRSLSLQNNRLTKIPSSALEHLRSLEALHLDGNQVSVAPPGSLSSLRKLQRLWLNGNLLKKVPTQALGELSDLEALNLGDNKIQLIEDYSFINCTKLVILMLHRNEISYIGPKGFDGLSALKVLEIHDNQLTKLPFAISSLPTLRELVFSNNDITELSDDTFRRNPMLTLLEMGGNPITSVGSLTFANLPNLKKLTVSEARQMETFPDLTGTSALEHLRLDRANLHTIPQDLCQKVPLLRSLNLRSNQISVLPDLEDCRELMLLDLSYNEISTLGDSPFLNQNKLLDLFLSHNFISYIPEDAFHGMENLRVLDLMKNRIEDIHPKAFANLTELKDLNLGENKFPILPSEGLQNLLQLKTFNNKNLREFPSPDHFPKVHTLALSYAYHCCMFQPLARRLPLKSPLRETIVWLTREDVDMSVWSTNITDVWPGYENFSSKFEEFASQLWRAFGRDYTIPDNLAQFAEEYFQNYKISHGAESSGQDKLPVQCLPEPGPFMPCEDLFGWWSLRCGVWVVFLLAMLGNGVVVIVLMFGRSKFDVPRFLVCNLAIADFFMGIYLGILAVVDASTLGEFREYAIQWQMSSGCQIAGFLGVLSSELSVYTLAVITLERNYAITHAMHLNKRLSLKHAAYIMGAGWSFALLMAVMPLFGVSDYRKFAVCLPFETEDGLSMSYVVFLIMINGVAFLTLMGCYLKMYWVIRGSQAWNSNDSRIAKRMALLVITDFICWAPIAFFSLTSVCGVDLISLEEAKVFTIFVLPLNSCANPFLYAIFTKQFKKDCVLICKRIEESRVTRGIGRCRHSSNFSNRHTPANTNSAAERKSGGLIPGDGQPVCQCATHLRKPDSGASKQRETQQASWKSIALKYLTCQFRTRHEPDRSDYNRTVIRMQRAVNAHQKRGSSISSENFSSRSDSWRQGQIPLRLLEKGARRNSWTCTQKSSQDSSNSCSRQDSSTSTFRLSRSSVSSDASSSRRGMKDRAASLRLERQHSGINGELPPSSTTRFVRGSTLGNIREKPKLCRQGAVVDETCQIKPPVRDITALKRSPPTIPAKRGPHGVCTTCGRRETLPSLRFKSKELEEKFNCFYSRLVETSNEESSEATTSKEEHIVSTDQSTADGKTDSGKETVDTSLSEQPSDDFDLTSPVSREPPATVCDSTKTDGEFQDVRHSHAPCAVPSYTLMTSGIPTATAAAASAPCRIPALISSTAVHISTEDISRSKSQSMSNLGFEFKLFSRRKAVSDNSLKKISLKSLPAFLRSLSSQSTQSTSQKPLYSTSRSHSQLIPHGASTISAFRSETTILHRSPDSSRTTVCAPYLSDRFNISSRDLDSEDEEEIAKNGGHFCERLQRNSSVELHHVLDGDSAVLGDTEDSTAEPGAQPEQITLCVTNSTASESSPLIDKEVRTSPQCN